MDKADRIAKKFGMLVDSKRVRKNSPPLFMGGNKALEKIKISSKTIYKSGKKKERILGRWDKEEHDKFIVGL